MEGRWIYLKSSHLSDGSSQVLPLEFLNMPMSIRTILLQMQECYFYLKYMTFGDTDPLAQNFRTVHRSVYAGLPAAELRTELSE